MSSNIKKIKPILPSLREKKRYLVYESVSEMKIQYNYIKRSINSAILSYIGELGYANAGIIILPENKNTKGILRVNTKYLDKVKASLTLIESINKERVIVKSVGVSGTLKKAKQKFMI